MAVNVATWLVYALGAWFAIGLLVGIAFVLFGAGRVDPAAQDGTRGFRVLILPGAAALWPLLLKRWLGGTTHPPQECNAHRRAAAAARSTQ